VRICWILISCFTLAGCANSQEETARQAVADYSFGDYASAQKLLMPIAKETDENFVLNNVRLGSTTLVQYDLSNAEAAFLRAYEVLNSFGVNNGGRSLGAVLVDEKIKVWRGEPFDRAMANFYLGLVYYIQGDYSNARGAFENALFKLRDYKNSDDPKSDQYRDVESDFALAQYMLARCWQRLGRDDLAHANFKRLTDLRPDLVSLADYDRNLHSNLLLVIDYGWGPHLQTNFDGAIVGFRPLPSEVGPPPIPRVFVDGQVADTNATALPLVDLIALAQDRRWESIDTIRVVKSAIGSGLIAGGAYELGTARRQTDAEVGLGLLAAGLLLKATSQADVRTWELLPRSTYVIPLSVPPGAHDVTIDFPYMGSTRQLWHGLIVPPHGEATYYFRMQRFSDAQFAWPPPTLSGWPPSP
jgi:tetratricopeptide (TPR) repeat protein